MPRWFAPLISLACLALAGCGGGSDDAPTTPGGGGGGETDQVPVIRGGQRLVWDQRADSSAAVRSYTFRLYVDGALSSLSSVSCAGTHTAAGYECSGVLPAMAAGRHTLQLASVAASGGESVRSAGFVVMVASALTTGAAVSSMNDSADQATSICLDDVGNCYQPTLIGRVNAITATATAGDRFFFIEKEQFLRLIVGNRLVETPIMTLSREEGRLQAVAVLPDYAQSRHLYVAWSASSRSGAETLSITRYREVQGTLGEGATILTGLTIADGALVQMATDGQGLMYITVPSAHVAGASATTEILRIQSDGAVPSSNPRLSPVIGYGYEHSSVLAWDQSGSRLWMAGDDPRVSTAVAMLRIDNSPRSTWPWSPVGVAWPNVPVRGGSTPRLSITTDTIWVIPSPGEVYRGDLPSNGDRVSLARVTFGTIEDVSVVASGPDASLIVISTREAGQSSWIWRLDPLTSRRDGSR